MSSEPESRFIPQNKTVQQRLSSNTVGLVALSDFRKRRAEAIEQQEREAREALASGTSTVTGTPSRSLTGTPDPTGSDASDVVRKPKAKKRKFGGAKLSFGDDEEDGAEKSDSPATNGKEDQLGGAEKKTFKFKPNASVSVVPRAMTKSALRREAAEREVLRKEFLARQEAVRATEIAIPFVFYDGTNIPGGIVRVKKGDYVWVFLDKSRKVGADLGVGEKANARREWARVGVDDLMMVRGNIIIPQHYEFLFFIMNKTVGPNDKLLFDYSADAPSHSPAEPAADSTTEPLSTAESRASKALALPDISTLEGASDDASFTKVVDRRWYERNKHIYPASVWEEFDLEKDYKKEVHRDLGGNTFFYK